MNQQNSRMLNGGKISSTSPVEKVTKMSETFQGPGKAMTGNNIVNQKVRPLPKKK